MAENQEANPVKKKGRPKGSKNKPKPEYKRPPGRPPKDRRPTFGEVLRKFEVDENTPPLYKCTCCGELTTNPNRKYYTININSWYNGNDHFSFICIDCTNKLFKSLCGRFGQKLATIMICSIIGKYYSEVLYEQMVAKPQEFVIGDYLKYLNGVQYRDKNFLTFLAERFDSGNLFMEKSQLKTIQEAKWSSGDKRNQAYAIQCVGYDPFEDESYTDNDRKYLFNTLAGYLTEEVVEDPHKIQCVIGMVQNIWQAEQLTQMINMTLRDAAPDGLTIQKLITTKSNLQATINKTARENAISASGSGKKSAASNSLTALMKAMINDGFDDIKANVIDAQMTSAYQNIAKINAKALQDELVLTSDDYAKMVAEQSETIKGQSDKLLKQEEEIRQLRIQVEDLETKVRVRGAKKVEVIEEDAEGEIT